ncbi:uncharacterized protein J4E84_010642 [Alternaria hordeiaustralica]|uniref:uncharacterized protein n=1 Tax=Alternaria hordeiaustralica TaxID=1187925 RepID=UPI0020C20D21|nr:uncharacterized protein J4E84_010642 [Alternaria hordeiaustralica]KAI4674267.1 hypothetical protein J4E84_010642 [Alternaria hordeiaustralica]
MAGHRQQGREAGEHDFKESDQDYEDTDVPPFVPAFGTPTAHIVKRKFSSKSDVASRHSSSSEPERSNEQPSTTPEEGHRAKRPRIEKDGSTAKTSGRPRKRTPDSAWQGNRVTSHLDRFGDISTEETSEILRQRIRTKQTELGSRIYGLEDSMNESFRNRVFMVLSEEAVSIPRRPEIPLGFRVKVEHWDFAGYLDEDSVNLLEALSKRVTTSQRDDKMDHDVYHSMDWRAIDDGRKAKGLAAYPRPDRRPPPRQTETPQHHPDVDESDNDHRRSDHRRRSDDRRDRDHRDSSRKDRGYSDTASYGKDRPQRPRDSDTRSSRPRSGKGKRADQYDDIDRSKADGPRGDHATEGTQSWNGAVQGIRAGSVYVGPNYYSRESTGRTDRMNDDEGPSGSRGLGGSYDRF